MQKDFQFTATVWKSKNGFWCGFANEISGVNCQSKTLEGLKSELQKVAAIMIEENAKTTDSYFQNSGLERETLILNLKNETPRTFKNFAKK